METKVYCKLAESMEDWFWQEGVHRAEPYQLPIARWLTPLVKASKSLHNGREALQSERASMAIWGPSQTGKSTLISAYVDSGAQFSGTAGEDGVGGGLHWPGGLPYFFMAPKVADPEMLPSHLTRMVLNPFNKGMDGSACLTRFVPGTLKAGSGDWLAVKDPAYPVQLHLVALDDLWHALARGFSTECLSNQGRAPRPWDLEKLKRTTRQVVRTSDGKPGAADRAAFEDLMRLAEVLNDLALSDDAVFSELSVNSDAWESYLLELFEEPHLLASRELVWKLAESLLWHDAPSITDWFRKMARARERWLGAGGAWQGKKLLCSLEATALFLNMGASEIAYAPRESNANSPRGVIQGLIQRLACTVSDDVVRIGCEPGLAQPLGASADDFSILQGLVWELVVPINMEQLPEKPFPEEPDRPNAFKDFLRTADILDFPGVGNETKALENRVIVDAAEIDKLNREASAPDASPQVKQRAKRCFTPVLFFKEILKRGKTASIVATYAKRLQIDGFSIFQGARGHACPNADQIINGVKSWWRYLCPEFLQDPSAGSPFPLNLAITWWAKQLNLAQNPNDTAIYSVIDGIVSNLGIIRDPSVSTTFAIHDHRSPDRDAAEIKQDFSPGSVRYRNLIQESGFKNQFSRPISKDSFDQMITDRWTGGAEFFFLTATQQMQELAARSDGRKQRILEQMERAVEALIASFNWPDLVPQPKVKDTRRECLQTFLQNAGQVLQESSPESLEKHNRFLRELLNIRPGDIPQVNSAKMGLVEGILDAWVMTQSQRMASLTRFSASATAFGLPDQNAMRELLRALADSLVPDYPELVAWLSERLNAGKTISGNQLQRLYAIKLGNTLLYGKKGPRTALGNADLELLQEERANAKPPALKYFLEPLLAPKGRIAELAAREISPRKRPDLSGDASIRKLYETFHPTANS